MYTPLTLQLYCYNLYTLHFIIQATIGNLAVNCVYYSPKTRKLLVRLDDSTLRQVFLVNLKMILKSVQHCFTDKHAHLVHLNRAFLLSRSYRENNAQDTSFLEILHLTSKTSCYCISIIGHLLSNK